MSDISVLRPLIGTWRMEASLSELTGRATFEWALGDQYVLERCEVPGAPESLAMFGQADDGLVQHYFDSRGVTRLYAVTFAEDVWTLSRETADFSELQFSQRYVGRVSAGRIDGAWEIAHAPGAWEKDFDLNNRCHRTVAARDRVRSPAGIRRPSSAGRRHVGHVKVFPRGVVQIDFVEVQLASGVE
ncbi:MAG: hypothetical protein QOF76_5430 [Solirubrobacteraceae bacterium]|nr:hypothetical protein [Solirubrobacteraceae bacterium]